jgi:hypothetical protein
MHASPERRFVHESRDSSHTLNVLKNISVAPHPDSSLMDVRRKSAGHGYGPDSSLCVRGAGTE